MHKKIGRHKRLVPQTVNLSSPWAMSDRGHTPRFRGIYNPSTNHSLVNSGLALPAVKQEPLYKPGGQQQRMILRLLVASFIYEVKKKEREPYRTMVDGTLRALVVAIHESVERECLG